MNVRSIAFLSMTLLTSCDSAVNETEYPGVYVLNVSSDKETVEIVANGTYRHKLEKEGAVVVDETGYWNKDEAGGRKGITFIAFQRALGPEPKLRGYWFVVPEKSWAGKVQLCIDDSICFEKM